MRWRAVTSQDRGWGLFLRPVLTQELGDEGTTRRGTTFGSPGLPPQLTLPNRLPAVAGQLWLFLGAVLLQQFDDSLLPFFFRQP